MFYIVVIVNTLFASLIAAPVLMFLAKMMKVENVTFKNSYLTSLFSLLSVYALWFILVQVEIVSPKMRLGILRGKDDALVALILHFLFTFIAYVAYGKKLWKTTVKKAILVNIVWVIINTIIALFLLMYVSKAMKG
jgi:drug/metabolite transporter (DMT)-like permease